MCCGRTKIVQWLIELPKVLTALLGICRTNADFRRKCRRYNNFFAFTVIESTDGSSHISGGS